MYFDDAAADVSYNAIATENEASCMILFLKVLDTLSSQEFVMTLEDEAADDLTAQGGSSGLPASPSSLALLLREANVCEVVCVGK